MIQNQPPASSPAASAPAASAPAASASAASAPSAPAPAGPRLRASIIIVTYNSRHHLENGLPALIDSTGRDTEIILVDNHSNDGIAHYIAHNFPQISLIASATNLGFAGGSNLGARHAQGDYLLFLNPDTIVTPGWLEPLVDALDADPQAGLATPKILLAADPQHINTGGNDIHCTGLTLCRGLGLDHDALAEMSEVAAVSGAAFAIRRQLFRHLNGFDETFFMYLEDTDLSWRARLAGRHTLYVPQSTIYHHYALTFGPRKLFYQERNRYLMLLKTLRWPTLFLMLPILFLAEIVTWGFLLTSGRANIANKLRAYHWLITHWPTILDKRRQTRSLRQRPDRHLLHITGHRLAFDQVAGRAIAPLARLIFDPLFYGLRALTLALVRW